MPYKDHAFKGPYLHQCTFSAHVPFYVLQCLLFCISDKPVCKGVRVLEMVGLKELRHDISFISFTIVLRRRKFPLKIRKP